MGGKMDFRPSSPHPNLLRKRSHVSQLSLDIIDDYFPPARSCRSLPGLRLPLSRPNSPIKDTTRSHNHNHERPSSAGGRRSVSGMKSLLPLRLQSAPPMPRLDVSAWVDNTIRQTQSCNTFDVLPHHQEVSSEEGAAWMGSRQHQVSTDISPIYQQTSVYSEPGSPSLSRAYASDDEPRTISRASDAASRPRLRTFYASSVSESVLSSDDDGLSGSAAPNARGEDFNTSGNIRDPILSPRHSGLSIKCQGESATEEAWLKPTSRLASGFEKARRPVVFHSPFESWIESDSSRCSSSLGSYQVYDALETPLSPGRAHVVDVTSERAIFSPRVPSQPPAVGSLHQPLPAAARGFPAFDSPFSPERSIRGFPHTEKTYLDPITTTTKPQPFGLQTPPMTPPLSTASYHYPPISISISMSNPSPLPPNSSTNFTPSIADPTTTSRILSGVSAAVAGFPSAMLFLDTPCIIEIRRLNQRTVPSTSPSLSPDPTTKHTHPPAPDLTPLRAIFPSTDDWWRSVLYAHLLALNYVCAVAPRLVVLQEGLRGCIGRVVECMAGHGAGAGEWTRGVEGTLVRALAEVVRGSV